MANRYEKSIVVLTDEVMKSAKLASIFMLDAKQIEEIKETRELSIEITSLEIAAAFGPTFLVANVEITVPWSVVRSIIRIVPEQSASNRSPVKRYVIPPTSGSWMT